MNLSLHPEENDTSTVLDLVRFLAAFAVLFGHAISFFGVARGIQAPAVPYMQNMGVLVFFVLSGFLIAFVLERASENGTGFRSYLIDRFARIYSGLFPVMLVIGAADWWMVAQSVHGHPQYATLGYWFGNLAMLNGNGAVPNFGSAGQLWTLAVEVHLYIFVAALYFFWRGRSGMVPLFLGFAFAAVPVAYASFAREPGAGIAWLWFLGFASFYLVRSLAARLPTPLLAFGFVALAVLLAKRTVPAHEYDGAIYPLFAAAFVALVLLTQQTKVFCARRATRAVIRYCADFSFTLYLVHHTVLYLLHRLVPDSGWVGVGAGVAISLALSVALAHLGEMHHKSLARRLKGLLLPRAAFGPVVSAHQEPVTSKPV